jgi:hypothetical protein
MKQVEASSKVSFVKGSFLSQISLLENDGLYLFIKKEPSDRSSFCKIILGNVLGFHDTGIIGNRIEYIDVGVLGFKFINHARKNDKDPEEYCQIVFKCKDVDNGVELIIACQQIEVVY